MDNKISMAISVDEMAQYAQELMLTRFFNRKAMIKVLLVMLVFVASGIAFLIFWLSDGVTVDIQEIAGYALLFFAVLILAEMLIVMVMAYGVAPWMARKYYRNNQQLMIEVQMSWNDKKAIFKSSFGENHYEWHMFRKIVPLKNYLSFWISDRQTMPIPKKYLTPSQIEQICSYVTRG